VAETRMAAKMSPLRSRNTMTSRAIPTTSALALLHPSMTTWQITAKLKLPSCQRRGEQPEPTASNVPWGRSITASYPAFRDGPPR
jgi:hypothetical protein